MLRIFFSLMMISLALAATAHANETPVSVERTGCHAWQEISLELKTQIRQEAAQIALHSARAGCSVQGANLDPVILDAVPAGFACEPEMGLAHGIYLLNVAYNCVQRPQPPASHCPSNRYGCCGGEVCF